jgi:hypothetical protein
MEGITPTLVVSAFAGFALGALSLILYLVAVGVYLYQRPALKLFATATLCAMASAGFFGLVGASERHEWSWSHLYATCLLLSGIGQCLTAFRHPGHYPASLACAAGSAAFALGPLTFVFLHTWLRELLVIVPCVLLAVASLIASLGYLPNRPLQAIILANLVLFDLALTYSVTDDFGLRLELDGGMTFQSLLADLRDNTHWPWVLAATGISLLITTALYRGFKVTRRRVIIAFVIGAALAAQLATATLGMQAAHTSVAYGELASGRSVTDFKGRVLLPGLIRCEYFTGQFGPSLPKASGQIYQDTFVWYGFGCLRVRHVLVAAV